MKSSLWDRIVCAATELNVSEATIRQWKRRKKIPADRKIEIYEELKGTPNEVSFSELDGIFSTTAPTVD